MSNSKPTPVIASTQAWLARAWVQWLLAAIFFFLLSWLFMGSALTSCSSTTTALGSDSTGGFAWNQWATGNGLSWGHTVKSNYPFGENLGQPQYITSTIFIFVYKVFSTLSTPICGLNMMVLLAYMSTALLMFGLVKWLLKRPDIAVFAGFAAAFVPFHLLKSESHINYMYGSIFIAVIWAYLWFMNRPSYKRAVGLAVVSSLGFYFDGYFVLISAVLVGALFSSSFVFDVLRSVLARRWQKTVLDQARTRLKYLLTATILLGVLLIPILLVYKADGANINQSLAVARSPIKAETEIYGVRPIEFLLPSYNNWFVPASYTHWRTTKLHGSNFSESTLYIGYTVMLLAVGSLLYLWRRQNRQLKLQNMAYQELVFTLGYSFLVCLALSLPAVAYIFGHHIRTPVDVLVHLTANWRVLSRFFLAMDPLVIIAAALGLYMLTRHRSKSVQLAIVVVCGGLLFLEYLPRPVHPTGNLYKDAPPIYKQLAQDHSAKIVAEYPLASFVYTPEIFTFQPVYNKTLVNSSNASISEGPFDASIAGLNDPQTAPVLKALKVDVIITHGFQDDSPDLVGDYPARPIRNTDGTINLPASAYSYKLSSSVVARPYLLAVEKGGVDLSVDTQQISHRIVTTQGTMGVLNLNPAPPARKSDVSLSVSSICPTNARVSINQAGRVLWSGSAGPVAEPINLVVGSGNFYINTANCSIDITNLDVQSVST